MQFLYRLGAVVIGASALIVISAVTWLVLDSAMFPHHALDYEQVRLAWQISLKAGDMDAAQQWAAIGRSIQDGGLYAYQSEADHLVAAVLSLSSGVIAAAVFVLTWRWICGQKRQLENPRPVIVYDDNGDGRGLRPVGMLQVDTHSDEPRRRVHKPHWALIIFTAATLWVAFAVADAVGVVRSDWGMIVNQSVGGAIVGAMIGAVEGLRSRRRLRKRASERREPYFG